MTSAEPVPGSSDNPLRVAIVGSGPSGFYTAQHLFAQKERVIEIDMFDRLGGPIRGRWRSSRWKLNLRA